MHISRQKSITSRSIKKTGALIVITILEHLCKNFTDKYNIKEGINNVISGVTCLCETRSIHKYNFQATVMSCPYLP